jgi:hypothetical protein
MKVSVDEQVWILSWQSHDGSESGVIRVYANEVRAQQDMDLLEAEFTENKYELQQLPVYT